MNLTAHEIGRVTDELGPFLKGRFLNKLFQTFDDEWLLEFKKGTEKSWLLVSLSKNNGRLHLASSAPEHKLELSSYSRIVKKALVRKPLDSISQWMGDRVVILEFATPLGRIRLIVELLGSTANMFMVDHNGTVIAMALDKKSRNSVGEPYHEPGGAGATVAPVESPQHGSGGHEFSRELELKYAGAALSEKLDSLKTRALSPLKTEKKRIKKRLNSLQREEAELAGYENDKNIGDILQASFAQIKRGAGSIDLPNLFSDGQEMLTIILDPALGPRGNIEKYYKRHRKYIKGVPRISADRNSLEERSAELDAKAQAIETASEIADLDPLIEGGVKKQKKPGKKPQPKRSGPRRFMTTAGHLALVGRNDKENDEITFRGSNGRDLWLHARDYPGSHVVVKLPKNTDPPHETLKEAAMLALHYSKAAKAGKGEVTYCRAKDIRKPKGAPAGKVLVHGAKSIFIRIDDAKIKAMKQAAEI